MMYYAPNEDIWKQNQKKNLGNFDFSSAMMDNLRAALKTISHRR
jgi:hypothetical protein